MLMSMSCLVSEADSQFYLALNGTDSTSCGHNISTACRTFPWLLHVFYNESDLNNTTHVKLPRLNLITAASFEIGPQILVSYHIYRPQTYYDEKAMFLVLFVSPQGISYPMMHWEAIIQWDRGSAHTPSPSLPRKKYQARTD